MCAFLWITPSCFAHPLRGPLSPSNFTYFSLFISLYNPLPHLLWSTQLKKTLSQLKIPNLKKQIKGLKLNHLSQIKSDQIKIQMASATTSTSSATFYSLSSAIRSHCSYKPSSHVTFRRALPVVSAVHAAVDECLQAASVAPVTSSFYEVLGIEMYATRHEIKAAYRRLARVVHPDAASKAQKEATSSADDFIRVHEAYVTLSDPRKRTDYDKMLMLKRRRISYAPNYAVGAGRNGTTSRSGFSGYTRRTWETDQCW